MTPAALAQKVLTLGAFRKISQEDYRVLLQYMLHIEQLERTEHGGLIIGRGGEKIVNSHKFLTGFLAPEYFLVKEENRTIGTVDKAYAVGIRFALAGMSWETVDINVKSKVIFVKKVPGISVVDWDRDFEMEFHTVLVRKVRSVMKKDDEYPYLSDRCAERLAEIRYIARNSGILDNLVTPLSDKKYAVFPWVGTRQLVTLHYALLQRKIKNKMPWVSSLYLEVVFEGGKEELERVIRQILVSELDLYSLPLPDKIQINGKYNEFVPMGLLRKQFIEDYLDFEGLKRDMGTPEKAAG